MKKLLLTACCFILLGFQSKAQLDTIPNASFESWYYLPNSTVQATGWHSNNSSIAAWNVMPDSISVMGALSLELNYVSYRGIIWSGFPIAHHPLSLDGYMKNYLNLGDTALISIHVYNSNTLVDSGYAEIYGGIATVFLPFTVNITQNASVADSCVITLTGGNMSGSISWFDDLSLSFPTSVNENFSDSGWKVFPNPATDELVVWSSEFGDKKEIKIYDVGGNKLFSQQLTANSQQQVAIDISDLPDGIYLLSVGEKNKHNTLIIKK